MPRTVRGSEHYDEHERHPAEPARCSVPAGITRLTLAPFHYVVLFITRHSFREFNVNSAGPHVVVSYCSGSVSVLIRGSIFHQIVPSQFMPTVQHQTVVIIT